MTEPTTPNKYIEWFQRWTPVVKEARTFILALVALLTALAALITAFKYVGQVAQHREETKTAVGILATDISTVQKTTQQNHDDIVALNEYLIALNEQQLDAAPASSPATPPKTPPPIWQKPAQDAGVAPSATSVAVIASSTPLIASASIPKRKPPPSPGPRPEAIDPMKANSVFVK